jgi:sRNA-binding regulator protein Hfq
MKDIESTAARRAPDTEDFANRKLIRPTLPRDGGGERRERTERLTVAAGKKVAPPDQTHAENFYYQKQMQSRTPMVVVLKDGEQVQGIIEWYDRNCIKLNRTGGHANLLIYKPNIKYMYKASER